MALVNRIVNFTLALASPSTFANGKNTVALSGFRATTRINKAGGQSMSVLNAAIYGVPLPIMNEVSTLGQQIQLVPRNVITVTAGDALTGMGTVFIGNITNAYPNLNSAPDVALMIEAHTLGAAANISIPPTSYNGPTDVATALSSLATIMGQRFENNGVKAQLSSSYLPGSARDQALKIVNDAGISWNGGDDGTLAIWPKNGSRGGTAVVVASPPEGGMIGYPNFTANGITVRTLFNPSIGGLGARIQVKSILSPQLAKALGQSPQGQQSPTQNRASGIWAIYNIEHALDTLLPHGKWESTLSCYNPSFSPPVVPGD